ncbi:transcription factor MYB3R-3-like isoform X1 [Iris pallida]|uniref:Transcription factor MYB3R-3-like isoform X1 n=1 Tax=Iris pallida TaxID=29817 RepID=A0AAX6H2A1_IRIPA|nr:transcription factor MYB3R-3-like isoform X1 [Iris pallida]KAJ6839752.1 transcription factor MYB3R-3-like isoform X1 [Iris pallida]
MVFNSKIPTWPHWKTMSREYECRIEDPNMSEIGSLQEIMIDSNRVSKHKRKKVCSGLDVANGNESLSSDSLRARKPSSKRNMKDIDISQSGHKIKGDDGVRSFFFLLKSSYDITLHLFIFTYIIYCQCYMPYYLESYVAYLLGYTTRPTLMQ